ADINTTDLSEFLAESGIPISDLYKSRSSNQYSWTRLVRETENIDATKAFQPVTEIDRATEEFLLKRLRTMLHINDRKRADNYLRILDPPGPAFESFDEELRAYARMLVLSFWAAQPQKLVRARFTEALRCVRRIPAVGDELRQIMEYATSSARVIPRDCVVGILHSHAHYSLADLIGALEDKPLKDLISVPREGVRYIEKQRTDLFLVTFKK